MTGLAAYYAAAATIYKFWLGQGLTPAQAAGVLAQFDAEANLDPQAIGDHDHAFGLAQLHDGRIAVIKARTGIDIRALPPIEDQCKAVAWELRHVEHRAWRALLASRTAYDAGYALCRYYERPASTEQYGKRGARAEQWAVYFSRNKVT